MPVASVRMTVAAPVGRPGVDVGDEFAGVVALDAGGGVVVVAVTVLVVTVVVETLDGVAAEVEPVWAPVSPPAPRVAPGVGTPDEQAPAVRARATAAARAALVERIGMRHLRSRR